MSFACASKRDNDASGSYVTKLPNETFSIVLKYKTKSELNIHKYICSSLLYILHIYPLQIGISHSSLPFPQIFHLFCSLSPHQPTIILPWFSPFTMNNDLFIYEIQYYQRVRVKLACIIFIYHAIQNSNEYGDLGMSPCENLDSA